MSLAKRMSAMTGLGKAFDEAPPPSKVGREKSYHGNVEMIDRVQAMVRAANTFVTCQSCKRSFAVGTAKCPWCSDAQGRRQAAQAKRERKMAARAKQSGRVSTTFLVTLAVVIGIIIIGHYASKAEDRRAMICGGMGGVLVKTAGTGGAVCVRAEVLP